MVSLIDRIIAEEPDFPLWLAKSMTHEYLEFLWKMYSAQLTPEQVKRLLELNTTS